MNAVEPTMDGYRKRLVEVLSQASDDTSFLAGSKAYIDGLAVAVIQDFSRELTTAMKDWHGASTGPQIPPGPALLYVHSDEPRTVTVLDRADWNTWPLPAREEALMEALLEHVDRQREARVTTRGEVY